jgi:glycosyltransferase involved in cell wall biosynthesis
MTALKRHLSAEKLVNVPLWVQPQKALVKTKKPNELTLLVYGFVTPYKGVDWLVEQVVQFNQKNKLQKLKLIIAGGKAPSQQGKPDYEAFYKNIANFAAQHAEIVLTGFIPTPRVKQYFAEADVVILPYRGILGSSASLAAGLAHGKPCVMSSDLLPYLASDDVQLALQETGVTAKQLIFKRTPQSFRALVQRLQSETELVQLAKFAKKLATQRSPATRLSIERDLIYSPQAGQNSLQWLYGFAKAKTATMELAAE